MTSAALGHPELAVTGTSGAIEFSPTRAEAITPALRWVAAIIVVGTLWGCLYAACEGGFTGHATPFGEEPMIALHLARGHGYRSPFDLRADAPFTSWSPPVYPAIMSLAYRAFGTESRSAESSMLVLNALCFGLTAGALFLAGSWLVNRATGLIAATILLLHPIFVGRIVYFWDAYMALAMFAWVVAWAIWLSRKRHQAGFGAMAMLGGALGVLALTNTAYFLTYPALFLMATRGEPGRRRAAMAGAALAGLALIVSPWTIRNYAVFHRVFFVRAEAPVELWIGNHAGSSGVTEDVVSIQPFLCKPERAKVLAWGELAYFDDCYRRFVEERRAHPGHFAFLSAARASYLVFGDPFRALEYPLISRRQAGQWYPAAVAFNGTAAILGLAGVYLSWRLGRRRVAWCLLLGLLSIVPYIPTHVDVRYAMPLKALLLLPTAALLAAAIHRLRNGRWQLSQ